MKQEPKRSHDSWDPCVLPLGHFFKGTSTVAVGDWICKPYSEMSMYLKTSLSVRK